MADLIINQTGLPAGAAGISRSDGLRTGALVTLSHNEANSVYTSYELLWVPDDDGTAVSTFTTVGNTATFSPDPASIGGTYRIRLRVTTANGTSETVRLFAIRTANGIRIPALNELADERASLVSNGSTFIEASEFNEPSASGPFAQGNYGGWYSAYSELVKKVEEVAGGGGANTWNSVYEVDFTTLPTQAFPAPGAHVIDGKTWWMKGMFIATPGGLASSDLINGVGLRLRTNFSISYASPGLSPNTYLRWFLPFTSLVGYNPNAPVAVQFRCTGSSLLRYVMGGFLDSTSDAVGPTAYARNVHTTWVGSEASSPTATYSCLGTNGGGTPQSKGIKAPGSFMPTNISQCQFSVVMPSTGIAYMTMTEWAGSFADLWTLPLAGGTQFYHIKDSPITSPINLGFNFTAQDQAGGSTVDYFLTHLRVSQPKA